MTEEHEEENSEEDRKVEVELDRNKEEGSRLCGWQPMFLKADNKKNVLAVWRGNRIYHW